MIVVTEYKDVPVIFAPAKRKHTPYQRMWKTLMKHLKTGYIVDYEEFYNGQGELQCRAKILAE